MEEHTPQEAGQGTPTASPVTKSPKPQPSRLKWLWLPVIAVLGVGAWYLWTKGATPTASAGAVPKGGKKGGSGVVPVVAAKAQKGNIGVYETGLGSVIPIYTVTVKSRVDGQLMTIHYKEGELVKENDLLVEIDKRPYQAVLDQAEGNLLRDQALLANARVDLDRYTKLLAQNAIPEQQLATQQATVKQDEGIVKADQGAIDTAKVNLVYCDIRSPITGRIGLRLVDPGNIVLAASTSGLLVITQVQPISVIFTLAEDDLEVVLRKLAAGQHLSAYAYDRANIAKIGTGTLVTVDNQIDPTTGSLRLRADFDNSKNLLFPNQFVNVRLLVEEKRGVTLVPTAVIQRTTSTVYVYVVKSDQTVTVRQIMLGVTEGDNTEVTSGLAPGDIVVMTGTDQLQEGSHVTVQMADQPANGQSAPAAGQPAPAKAKSGGKKK
jgi:membrane fusion protein, multidrug efflux system